MTDDELLKAYTSRGDTESFRRLVERYTPLVYRAARRQVGGDAHVAEDVTQAVFILLSRKAASVRRGALAGWLVNAARLCAREAVRELSRRRARETLVAIEAATGAGGSEAEQPMPSDAQGLAELIDDALCRLGEADRTAVTLRYLQGKSQREVAQEMGISEAAAAQRVSRAISKLRRLLERHKSLLFSGAMLGETMYQQLHLAAPAAPAQLSQAAADAALQGGAASPLASSVATKAAAAMRRRVMMSAVAATGLACALLLGGALTAGLSMGASSHRGTTAATTRAATATATAAAAAPIAQGPVRVGIFVSAASALPRPPRDNAWFNEFSIADDFKGVSDVELIPIIEPNTADQPQQKRLLGHYFPDKAPIDVTDAAALNGLDVIVAAQDHTPTVAALQSIERAVSEGRGLFARRCLGNCLPTSSMPVTWRLRGLATHANTTGAIGRPTEWTVLASHPILGSLTPGSLKTPIKRRVAGVWGTLPPGAVPLIRLAHPELLRKKTGAATQPTDAPLGTDGEIVWVSSLGKGRIVSCNFWAGTPPELQEATGNRFTSRAVKWLANREVK